MNTIKVYVSQTTVKTVCNVKQLSAIKGFMGKKKFKKFRKKYNPETQLDFNQANKIIRCYLANRPFNIIKIGEICLGEMKLYNTSDNTIKSIPVKPYKISQYTLDGKFVKSYHTNAEAYRELGIKISGDISNCLKGNYKTSKGYQWCYVGKEDKIENLLEGKSVKQYDLNGNFIRKYNSANEVANANKDLVRKTGIRGLVYEIKRACEGKLKTVRGYQWCYDDTSLVANVVKHKRTKAISQFSLDGEFIKVYPSISIAVKELNLNHSAIGNISGVCRHKKYVKPNGNINIHKKVSGFLWCFTGDEKSITKYKNNAGGYNRKEVSQYTLDGEYVQTFPSRRNASIILTGKENGLGIDYAIREKKISGGFQWRYGHDKNNIGEIILKYHTPKPIKIKKPVGKPISQYTLDGEYVQTFPSRSLAEKLMNVCENSTIASCLIGKSKVAYGFQWRFGDNKENIGKPQYKIKIKIHKTNEINHEIFEWMPK